MGEGLGLETASLYNQQVGPGEYGGDHIRPGRVSYRLTTGLLERTLQRHLCAWNPSASRVAYHAAQRGRRQLGVHPRNETEKGQRREGD